MKTKQVERLDMKDNIDKYKRGQAIECLLSCVIAFFIGAIVALGWVV